jgi:hypothetical protein
MNNSDFVITISLNVYRKSKYPLLPNVLVISGNKKIILNRELYKNMPYNDMIIVAKKYYLEDINRALDTNHYVEVVEDFFMKVKEDYIFDITSTI